MDLETFVYLFIIVLIPLSLIVFTAYYFLIRPELAERKQKRCFHLFRLMRFESELNITSYSRKYSHIYHCEKCGLVEKVFSDDIEKFEEFYMLNDYTHL